MSALPSLNHLVNKQGGSISHWFGHWFAHGRPFDSDCELYLLICLLIHPWFTLWEDRTFQWLIDLPCDQPCSNTGAITNSLMHLLIHPVATLCGSWVDQWHAAALIDSPMGHPLIRLLQELGCAISTSTTHWIAHESIICPLISPLTVLGMEKWVNHISYWNQRPHD